VVPLHNPFESPRAMAWLLGKEEKRKRGKEEKNKRVKDKKRKRGRKTHRSKCAVLLRFAVFFVVGADKSCRSMRKTIQATFPASQKKSFVRMGN